MSYQTNKEMRTVTISIPQELVQKIDSIAIDEERSRSKMIEILLKKILYKNSPNLMKSNKILNLKNTVDSEKNWFPIIKVDSHNNYACSLGIMIFT